MATGGYPTAVATRSTSISTSTPVKALKPPLPDVQKTGPKPFLDYPMKDWPAVIRRKGSQVPLVMRPAFQQAKKYGKYLPLALRAARVLNRYQDIFTALEAIEAAIPQKTRPVWNAKGWKDCAILGACTTPPAYQKHEGAPSVCSTTVTPQQSACLSLQAFVTLNPLGTAVPTTIPCIIFTSEKNAAGTRVTHVHQFVRNGWTGTAPPTLTQPSFTLGVGTVLREGIETTLDPMMLPIGQPVSTPVAVPYGLQPYRVRNPNRDPKEQYQAGYGVGIAPEFGLGLDAAPGLDPSPQTDPPPWVGVDVPGDGPPRPTPPGAVRAHTASRPRKREWEKKLNLGIKGKVGAIANIITESVDFVREVHKALPKKFQAKRTPNVDPISGRQFTSHPTPQAMAEAIWKHKEQVNWGKAVSNVINNTASDAFFGKLGSAAQKGNKKASDATKLRGQFGLGPAL